MSVELAVQNAIYDALTDPGQTALAARIGGRVYDRVSGGQPAYPYLVMSAIEASDISNSCGRSWLVSVTITAWSNAVGRAAEVMTIGGLVREILAPPAAPYIPISGYQIVTWQSPVAVYRPGANPLLHEGVVTVSFIVNPTP